MPTDDGKSTRNKDGKKKGAGRGVRPLRVFLACAVIILAATAAALFSSRDLLRYVAEDRLRVFLEETGRVDYHVATEQFHLFPPRIELEKITLGGAEEAWVLTADEAVVELSPIAFFFRGSGVATLQLLRPRYIQRGSELSAPGRPGDGPSAAPAKAPFDAPSLLARNIPLRSVKIIDGEIVLAGRGGDGLEIGGLDVSAALSGERLIGRIFFDEGFLVRGGTVWELGRINLDGTLDKVQATVRSLRVEAPLLEGELSGSISWDGAAEMSVSASLPVDGITERLGRGRPLEGRLVVKGDISGPVGAPAFTGKAVLHDPVAKGHRWPDIGGTVSWKEERFAWRDLTADIGGGNLASSGFFALDGNLPRYGISVTAHDFYPAALSPLSGTTAEAVRNVSGILRWEGSGFARDMLSGSGSVTALFGVEGREWAPVDLEAEGSLADSVFEVTSAILRSGDSLVRSRGAWHFDEGLRLYVEAVVGSLGRFLEPWDIEGFDGRLYAEGELAADREGLLFEGPIRWENGEAFGLRPFGATASVSFDGSEIALDNGRVGWRGSEIEAVGKLLLKERQIDLLTRWKDLSLAAVAPLFGTGAEAAGDIVIDGTLIGSLDEPILSGRFSARDLRYSGIVADEAAGTLSFAGGELDLAGVTLRSGDSTISFAGRLEDDRISGTLESPAFDLRAFVPTSAAEVVGTFRADLGGTVGNPWASGTYVFFTLNYETWSFKGAGGDFDYRDGAFTLNGYLAEADNHYRLKVEPRGGWPFDATVKLGSFSPELAQEGFLGLPAQFRRAFEKLSFLAVGEFAAEGMLKDFTSITAGLDLETIWVYTQNQTLANLEPLRVVWEQGVVTVDDFSVAGEDYRISLGGRGSLADGWDLSVAGHINLSIFQGYWSEIEHIDAPGNVELRLTGPWDAPETAGSFSFTSGEMKIAGLDEPITDISGSGELAEGLFVLNEFSGFMGENNFHAGGRFDLESRAVDAFVEGHLDLSVFRKRVPGTREMKGPVSARLTLKGSADRPQILGEAFLEGAELFHQAMPQRITGLSGKVVLEEKSLVVEEMAGKMGNGDISLEGIVDWSEEPVRVDVGLSASKVIFVLEDIAKALLSADLTLNGDFESLELSGDIQFHKARYFREFKDKIRKVPGLSAGEDGAPERKPSPGPDIGSTALDVSISAPDSFWIVNSTVELENSVAIRLGGTVDEPLLDGEIRLLRGEVTYFTRRFTLFSGRIFNTPPGINPTVEAQAEVDEGETRIFLLLEGPLKKPTLQLTSLPPLNQEDLMALLTVGQTRSSLEEQSGESIAIGAAIVFGTPVIEQIGEGAKDITGIEFFQVQPAMAEESGSAKVTLGTQLSDRLFMSASQTIGLTEEQQVRLEYQILDYVSVLGQQLRQGMYTLDLVFQWDFD